MKLILAIVSSDDSSMVSSALTKNNFFGHETGYDRRLPDERQYHFLDWY